MKKVIHIFDMDDTVMDTPTFAEFVGVPSGSVIDTKKFFPDFFLKMKAAFLENLYKEVEFKRMGDFVVPINADNKKPFGMEAMQYFPDKKPFETKDGIIVLTTFPGFHKTEETLGWGLNEPILRAYDSAENKMILTGRNEDLRDNIMRILRYNNVGYPNCGLKLFQPKAGLSIEQFKIAEILKSIKEFGWEIVHFYEDRSDWLRNAMNAVKSTYPQVEFTPHFVTNVKEKRSL